MKLLSSLLFFSFLISCGSKDENKTETVDYTQQNEEEIQEYLKENNLEAQKSDSGLYYIINEPGTGKQPSESSTVKVAYKGYFTNGKVFDKSSPEGISFGLNQVIKGWTEGITYFKEGGSGVLLIPSRLGYGNRGNSRIPAGSVLLFDIKLISAD